MSTFLGEATTWSTFLIMLPLHIYLQIHMTSEIIQQENSSQLFLQPSLLAVKKDKFPEFLTHSNKHLG